MGTWVGERAPTRGARCIVDVDSVNSPTGRWYGVVQDVQAHPQSRWSVTVTLTGPIAHRGGQPVWQGVVPHEHVHINSRVYAASPEALEMAWDHQRAQLTWATREAELGARLTESRATIRDMKVDSDVLKGYLSGMVNARWEQLQARLREFEGTHSKP